MLLINTKSQHNTADITIQTAGVLRQTARSALDALCLSPGKARLAACIALPTDSADVACTGSAIPACTLDAPTPSGILRDASPILSRGPTPQALPLFREAAGVY
jgi:hypothetical protein